MNHSVGFSTLIELYTDMSVLNFKPTWMKLETVSLLVLTFSPTLGSRENPQHLLWGQDDHQVRSESK